MLDNLNQPMGSTIGILKDGRTVQQAIDDLSAGWVFVDAQAGNTDTERLLAAVAVGKTMKVAVKLTGGKTYTLTGTTPLEIDLANFSFGTTGGRAKIDASAFTGPTALWIHATGAYPTPMYQNSANVMENIELMGGLRSGVDGWTWGSRGLVTGTQYNGQCNIRNCTVYRFDNNIMCTDSTWRYKVVNCMISTALTSVFNAPSGLRDSGESITFDDTQFSDANNAPFIVACASFSIGMSGSSILNTLVRISGMGAVLTLTNMGNYENPGKTSWVRYLELTGQDSRLIVMASTVVINQPAAQTRPVFYIGAGAIAEFIAVKFPGNLYMFHVDNPDKMRTFCEGPGTVRTSLCSYDIVSGAGNIPIHRSLNRFFNSGFENDLQNWTVNTSGQSTQLAEVVTDDTNTGTGKAVKLTSITAYSIYATTNVPVTSGEQFATFIAYKILKAGSDTNAGSITVSFYSKPDGQGVQIGSGSTSSFSSDVQTSWAAGGLFCRGVAPVGAQSAQVAIRVRGGAIVLVDDVVVNFV